jgi:hypothetical protein
MAQLRQKALDDRRHKAEQDPSTLQYRLKALKEKALRAKARQRKAQRKEALQPFPGIQNILNFPPLLKGALALGKRAMNPDVATSLMAGTFGFGQKQSHRKPKPAKNEFFEGARQVGGHLLDGVQSFSKPILKPGVDLGHSFLNGADVLGISLKESKLGQPKAQRFFEGALNQGKKLFKGAVDFSNQRQTQLAIAAGTISPVAGISMIPEAKKFTEAIPHWVDKHVDGLLKRRGAIAQTALKQIEHIPVLGKQAQAFAWFDNKACEFTGGVLKGAGSFVGGMANMVTHPIETASGFYTMAEHVPFMAGIVPNPLKLAHAGADILFNGADPKARLQTVTDPQKSLEDDAKFGKALVTGFIEPYKKSWAEGKYFEVAGRAAFDVGSLFIGAGEANAAVKGGEVASVAGKTAEVANLASRTSKVTNVFDNIVGLPQHLWQRTRSTLSKADDVVRGGLRSTPEELGGVRSNPAKLPQQAHNAGHKYAEEVLPSGTGRALAGHGEFRYGTTPKAFVVPDGAALSIWTKPDRGLPESIGQLIEAGEYDRIADLFAKNEKIQRKLEGAATHLPGARVPNYTLKAPKNLTVYEKSTTVEDPISLSNLVKLDSGHIDWAACTLFPGL